MMVLEKELLFWLEQRHKRSACGFSAVSVEGCFIFVLVCACLNV